MITSLGESIFDFEAVEQYVIGQVERKKSEQTPENAVPPASEFRSFNEEESLSEQSDDDKNASSNFREIFMSGLAAVFPEIHENKTSDAISETAEEETGAAN